MVYWYWYIGIGMVYWYGILVYCLMGVEELITQFAHQQVSQETFTKLSEDKKNK